MPWITKGTITRFLNLRDISIHLSFGILAIIACVFYAERIYADAAYYLFHLVNSESFYIEHSRLVLVLSQILPWIGVKLGVSMTSVLTLYSVGHVLFFYGIFLICRYRYQDRGAGLLLILLQTLGLEMGYFTPMFELYYGAGLLVLFASILWSQKFKRPDQIILVLLTVGILTSHPFAILLWGFVLVFHGLDFGKKYLRWYGILAGCLLLIVVYKAIASSSYEASKTSAFFDTFRVMSYGGSYLLELGRFMLKHYMELLLLLVLALTWMVVERSYAKLVLMLLGFSVMLVIINGAHYGFQHSRYQEQVYFPLTWIVAFPFTLSLTKVNAKYLLRGVLWALICLLIASKVIAILKESQKFERRTAMMERQISYVRELHKQKAIVGEVNITRQTSPDPNWSYSIETLLLSARDGRDSTVTICMDSDIAFNENREKLTPDKFLMRKWDIFPLKHLNRKYFTLNSGNYISLTTSLPEPDLIMLLKSAISISFPKEDLFIPRGGQWKTFDVGIHNNSAMFLPADTASGIFLSYHLAKGDDMILWDGQRTALEVDISSEYGQTIDVLSPEQTGRYTLIVDIVAEGRSWFGIDARKSLWVY